MSSQVVAVNGRFLTMPVTGAQRYAGELTARLPERLDGPLFTLVPPRDVLRPNQPRASGAAAATWGGLKGHAWEQLVLPGLQRAVSADVLVGLSNWGPLAVRHQVVAVLDCAPLRYPEFYSRAYVELTKHLQPRLARRATRVVTLAEKIKDEIVATYGLAPDRVDVVPPGVGEPFVSLYDEARNAVERRYCVFVGAHDSRKNLEFVLRFWPRIREEFGWTLHVTQRAASRPHGVATPQYQEGVVMHENPADEELAALYEGAACVLSPSHYEGFGLPLLEAMATGTPFLASDAGAANELAVDSGRQVLPLDPEVWIEHLRRLANCDMTTLRAASARRSRAFSWDASADALVASIRNALEAP